MTASLGDEGLAAVREELIAQLAKLQAELEFVEAALAKRPRTRKQSSSVGRTPGEGGRFSGIKRTDVLDLVRGESRRLRPSEVAELFATRGKPTNTEAMRTALNRLVGDGFLVKLDDGSFAVKGDETRNGNGGLPVTEPMLPSQDFAPRHES